MLKRRDEGKGKIYFVDVDAPDYRPEDNAGISYEQVYCLRIPSSRWSVSAAADDSKFTNMSGHQPTTGYNLVYRQWKAYMASYPIKEWSQTLR